jgi:hypothetical protein
MPTALPPEVPYAYVVEQRPLDKCAPPACAIRSQDVVGWWDELQSDGRRGSYFRFGDQDTEAYYRRAAVVRAGSAYEFALPALEAESDYDGYFAAAEGPDWRADVEIVLADGTSVLNRSFQGTNKTKVDAAETEDMGRYEDYFTHVRLPLPSRKGRAVTVRIRNSGTANLVVGSPLVLGKVLGRRPRQAFFVFFDGVSEPLFTRMFTGSGDPATEWLAKAVEERGTLFSHGVSPGFNTPTFVRRFFHAGFYANEGEPMLFGQGIDEQPPLSPLSPVARLAEQGFQTEATLANFLLMPTETRVGFDGGYQNEQQEKGKMHPLPLVRRFRSWLTEHPHDDAFNVVWFSVTHEPYPAGRHAPPFDLKAPAGIHYVQESLDPIWRNVLTSVDDLRELMDAAARVSPFASRLWLLGTDHGRTFMSRSVHQPTWLPPRTILESDPEHCCLASFEEARTPFIVLYDGMERRTPARVDEPTSTSAVWRLVERLYGVRLGLPETSTFSGSAIDPEGYSRRWDDGLLGSAGDSGSIRGLSGRWAYRSLAIRPQVGAIWAHGAKVQRLLTGTPNRGENFLAEELYDEEQDPFETNNVADANPDALLEMRRKLSDWLATYFDPPTHPRYEYALTFPREVTLRFEAPRTFLVGVDGRAPSASQDRTATLTGTKFVIREGEESTAIFDVSGAKDFIFLRCAATGLPLQSLSGEKSRLNLAVARNNCVTGGRSAELSPMDVAFSATLTKSRALGAGGVSSDELVEGLRRWGYVRDLDKPKKP